MGDRGERGTARVTAYTASSGLRQGTSDDKVDTMGPTSSLALRALVEDPFLVTVGSPWVGWPIGDWIDVVGTREPRDAPRMPTPGSIQPEEEKENVRDDPPTSTSSKGN